jgi:hypothetical protein
MAQTPAKLVQGSQLTTTAATYYASKPNVKTIIKSMQLVNTGANAAKATVYLVPAGGTAGAANTIIAAVNIAVGATYNCPEAINEVLEAGDTIQALSDTTSSISMQASGIQVV